jgi:hypothetical protein
VSDEVTCSDCDQTYEFGERHTCPAANIDFIDDRARAICEELIAPLSAEVIKLMILHPDGKHDERHPLRATCDHEEQRVANKRRTETLERFDVNSIGGHYEVVWCEKCGAVKRGIDPWQLPKWK